MQYLGSTRTPTREKLVVLRREEDGHVELMCNQMWLCTINPDDPEIVTTNATLAEIMDDHLYGYLLDVALGIVDAHSKARSACDRMRANAISLLRDNQALLEERRG